MATTSDEQHHGRTSGPVGRAVRLGRDVLYVGVGTGVLAVQRLQVERRELEQRVRSLLG